MKAEDRLVAVLTEPDQREPQQRSHIQLEAALALARPNRLP